MLSVDKVQRLRNNMDLTMEFRSLIREMAGKNRCDLTLLLARPAAFTALVEALAEPFRDAGITKVAPLDALGFPLGGAVAQLLGAGLVLIRKENKTAWQVESAAVTDYSGQEKRLEIAVDALGAGDRVLIVDDWSETGEQLRAAITLIERLGSTVVGAAFVHAEHGVRQDPSLSRYLLYSVIDVY